MLDKILTTKRFRIVPKIVMGTTSVILTLTTLAFGFDAYQRKHYKEKAEKLETTASTELTEDFLSYFEEQKHDLEIDTYSENANYININDMADLDRVLDYKSVSLEQLIDVINGNGNIPAQYKELLISFCKDLTSKYQDIELRVLYENLKTLEVVECNKQQLAIASLSSKAYGCYRKAENKIYVGEGNVYEYGTWPYQVIYHEFCHCLRTGSWERNGKKIRVQVNGHNFSNVMVEEALNSLFAVSLFNYEEKDIAYQLQSNYHKVMLECLDNYTLSDYVNHSLSYYAAKLDEYNQDDNYATVIMELIDMQYKDYHSESITADKKEYYPIYDYVAEMYYKKYLNSSMSYEQAKELTAGLIEKITFDVPADYNIDTDHFYDFLDEYCDSIGISRSGISR